jgi:hypothetical protein
MAASFIAANLFVGGVAVAGRSSAAAITDLSVGTGIATDVCSRVNDCGAMAGARKLSPRANVECIV